MKEHVNHTELAEKARQQREKQARQDNYIGIAICFGLAVFLVSLITWFVVTDRGLF